MNVQLFRMCVKFELSL